MRAQFMAMSMEPLGSAKSLARSVQAFKDIWTQPTARSWTGIADSGILSVRYPVRLPRSVFLQAPRGNHRNEDSLTYHATANNYKKTQEKITTVTR